MAAPNNGSGLIFNGAVGTTGAVTAPVDVNQMMMASFQTKLTTSAASVTIDVQVSNVPALRDNYLGATGPNSPIPAVRDDSYGSVDWVIVSTNTMAAVPASRMDVVAYVPQRVARLRLTSVGTTANAIVYVRSQGWGS